MSVLSANGWQVVKRSADPLALVSSLPEPEGARVVVVAEPSSSAVILGSAQLATEIDEGKARSRGIAIVRRRSGGGAVFVAPGAQIWIDVFVPVGDHLSDQDVGHAAWWLGEAWTKALSSAATSAPDGGGAMPAFAVHRGGIVANDWSRRLCFTGLGPGEVYALDRKVVGISQRRDRSGTWLHSMAHTSFDPDAFARLLRSTGDQQDAAHVLARSVATTNIAAIDVVSAILAIGS